MRKSSKHQGKSLKTLVLYSSLVILAICISLLIKIYFVVKQSKFDPDHHFVISFVEDNSVKDILVSNPDTQSQVLLSTVGTVSPKQLITNLYILPDAQISLPDSVNLTQDPAHDLLEVLWHYPLIKTNLTLYDVVRLYYFTKSVPPANTTAQSFTTQDELNPQTNLLIDNAISQENVTIQIVNATNTTGLGGNVAQILSLMGANIVEVSTALNPQNDSKIQYFGNDTYTLQKIAGLLLFPVSKISTQPVANIVITLGMDSQRVLPF